VPAAYFLHHILFPAHSTQAEALTYLKQDIPSIENMAEKDSSLLGVTCGKGHFPTLFSRRYRLYKEKQSVVSLKDSVS